VILEAETPMKHDTPDTLEMLLRHTGGDGTPEMAAELSRRLCEDAAARAELCDLALEAFAVAEQSVAAIPLGVGAPVSGAAVRNGGWRRWVLPLAAAVAMVAGVLGLLMPLRNDPEVVHVLSLQGPARWTGAAGRIAEPREGDGLRGGLIELLADDAAVSLRFDDGSLITLNGVASASFSASGQKQVRLRAGSLSASIAKQLAGRPFLLSTPTASMEVLGTRFTVESAPDETLLSVNEGAVRLTRLADGRVVDVPAEHQVLAGAGASEELIARRPDATVSAWRSDLAAGPRGTMGEWLPPGDGMPARLRSEPHMVVAGHSDPVTVYRVAATVPEPPLQLAAGSVIRVRGRLESPAEVVVMLVTKHLRGGYAGNCFRSFKPAATGEFDFELPVEAFVPARLGATELQLKKVHLYTKHRDAGLEVGSIEVRHQP
jgi:ferric-dicitrate binding protein FerR (iron transport regulator)